jgi:hypothetical protein
MAMPRRARPATSAEDFERELERWRGGIEERLDRLIDVVEKEQEGAARHRRDLREVIGALSQSVQLLTAEMRDVKPVVEDYREKRAEGRGAARLAKVLWIALGGVAGGLVSMLVEVIKAIRG